MKIFLILTAFLFINGVFDDSVKSVSVMEGDSVTLHTDITDIQRDYVIDWKFGDQDNRIAIINGDPNSLKIFGNDHDGIFRDKLKMNTESGDLTITNINTQHSGDYHLYIIREKMTRKTFSVYVSGDKVKTEMKGDSFILHNNVTKNPGDEKIVWRIRHNNSPIAEIIRNGKETNDEVHDGRFRGRLQVDDQTGDLNITNIRPDDSGSYEVDITVGSRIYTIHRSFNVTVKGEDQSSGLSPGVIGGLCVFALVLAFALAVAVFLYRRRSRTPGSGP